MDNNRVYVKINKRLEFLIVLLTVLLIGAMGIIAIQERHKGRCRDSILSALTQEKGSMPCGKAFHVSYTGENGRQTYFINKRPYTVKGD